MTDIIQLARRGWRELADAWRRMDLVLHLAWTDTRTRYRRSFLGPFWLVLGTAIGVGGLGFVWSALFQVEPSEFVPWLTSGLVVWYLLSTTTIEAAGVFYHNRHMVLGLRVSTFTVSGQLLARNVVTFAHNMTVVVAVAIIFPGHLSMEVLLVVPGLALVCINLLWVIQVVGYLGARFRDLEPLISAVMQPLFFITPVLFRPGQLGDGAALIYLNPLAHWLTLIRDPLVGLAPTATAWGFSIATAVAGWLAALWMTGLKRNRLPFWVH